jgi:hypothetical protein
MSGASIEKGIPELSSNSLRLGELEASSSLSIGRMIACGTVLGQARRTLELDIGDNRVLVFHPTERLAQMDRASASEAEGRAFESRIAQILGVKVEALPRILGRLGRGALRLTVRLLLPGPGCRGGRWRGDMIADVSDDARIHFYTSTLKIPLKGRRLKVSGKMALGLHAEKTGRAITGPARVERNWPYFLAELLFDWNCASLSRVFMTSFFTWSV